MSFYTYIAFFYLINITFIAICYRNRKDTVEKNENEDTKLNIIRKKKENRAPLVGKYLSQFTIKSKKYSINLKSHSINNR